MLLYPFQVWMHHEALLWVRVFKQQSVYFSLDTKLLTEWPNTSRGHDKEMSTSGVL